MFPPLVSYPLLLSLLSLSFPFLPFLPPSSSSRLSDGETYWRFPRPVSTFIRSIRLAVMKLDGARPNRGAHHNYANESQIKREYGQLLSQYQVINAVSDKTSKMKTIEELIQYRTTGAIIICI